MMSDNLTMQAWLLAALGAVTVGLGKGGLPGIGNLSVVLFVAAFGAKPSVGIVLPVLCCADIVAITIYKKHAQWQYVRKLFPVMAVGVVMGYFLFDAIPATEFGRVIGVIILTMTAMHFIRVAVRRRLESGVDAVPHTWWFIGGTGVIGGLATMLANAAGPVAAFYLMAVRLPKFAFVGTAAWLFFLVNLFKVPFQINLGLITLESIGVSLSLGAVAALACMFAPKILKITPQLWFERLVWAAVIISGLKLLLG